MPPYRSSKTMLCNRIKHYVSYRTLESSKPKTAPDAGVSPHQYLSVSTFVREGMFIGVGHRLRE